jgi:hypothetical protein
MPRNDSHIIIDSLFFALVVAVYIIGQILIGAYLPADDSYYYDAPADVDFLYYAGIVNQMKYSFPPQNPAYGGVPLSQSFVQYYPVVALSLVMSPYVAMRILNLVYLILLALVLRRYFPRGWGIGLAIISAGSIGFGLINSLGIDLIARGFNHFPFFIAFFVAVFEKRHAWLRYGCLFLLGWLHSFMALLALFFLAGVAITERLNRDRIIDVVICFLGLVLAASITLGVADKPFYFPFVEGFRVDLTHLWMHAVLPLVLVFFARDLRIYILFFVAFFFGLLFHYNPFFPVFMLYIAGGWAAMEIYARLRQDAIIAYAVAGILFVGFIVGAIGKYNPNNGNFVPHLDPYYTGAARWLKTNTPPESVLLTTILEPGWHCRLMETRAVYLGFIPHVAHLGIDWRERAQKILTFFRKPPVIIAEIDYVVYGPAERKLFPNFRWDRVPVYSDTYVTIWTARR